MRRARTETARAVTAPPGALAAAGRLIRPALLVLALATLSPAHGGAATPGGDPAGAGVLASMQPTHCTSDMPWVRARLRPEREGGCYAWHSILVAKAALALGSDCPVESEDPLLGLYAAVTRRDLKGNPPGGWHPEQRLTPGEALAGFTTGPAWAALEEEAGGALEENRRADFTVLDRDPLAVPAAELPRLKVMRTVVGGIDAWVAP